LALLFASVGNASFSFADENGEQPVLSFYAPPLVLLRVRCAFSFTQGFRGADGQTGIILNPLVDEIE